MNHQDDQTSEWQEKIEAPPEILAELENKARQKGLSLFAYLADFVIQDGGDSPTTKARFEYMAFDGARRPKDRGSKESPKPR